MKKTDQSPSFREKGDHVAKTPGKTPRKTPRKTAAKPVTDLPADPANTEAKAAKGPAKASPVKPQTPQT